MAAAYGDSHLIIQKGGGVKEYVAMSELVPAPDTSSWYTTQYGCLTRDQSLVASRHGFPDARLPMGKPEDPGAAAKICLSPAMKANAMNSRKHPQKRRDMNSALMG